MWQEASVPCCVQLSHNVPKTEKPEKFLMRSRSGAGRDVNPRPHIQLSNATHVAFQATLTTHCNTWWLECGWIHRLEYVSITSLPTCLVPVMMVSRSVTQTQCKTISLLVYVQYDVYSYVCHKVCSISVLVLAVGVVLLFYPAIKRNFRFLVTSANCVFVCFVSIFYNLPYVVRPSCKWNQEFPSFIAQKVPNYCLFFKYELFLIETEECSGLLNVCLSICLLSLCHTNVCLCIVASQTIWYSD